MNAYKYLIMLLLPVILTGSCVKEPDQTPFFEDDELSIAAWLEKNESDYSMFLELLDLSGFKSAFNAYGTYTLFVFKNDAFQEYLQEIGLSTVSEMSVSDAKVLVRYHALGSIVTSSNLGYGKLPVKNLEDDELISAFDTTGLQGIIINREARILTRDNVFSNGIVHVLDNTLTPIVKSVIEKMDDLGDFSIFVELAKQTGYYKILDKIYDTLNNGDLRRQYYTVFAEPDEVYQSQGINSFQDLAVRYDNGYSDHKNPQDSLNRFMANHIIYEKALFTKDFETGNYQSYYGELISFTVDQDYRINVTGPEDNQSYITFIVNLADYQAKNGVFHAINKILNIFYPEPVEVVWEFNDQLVIRDLGRVEGQNSLKYATLDPFPNMTGSVAAVYVHIPYDNYGFTNNRALILDPPDWDITFHMPLKIVKGRYKFYLSGKDGSGRATIQVLINGVPIGEPIDLNGSGSWYNTEFYVGEVNLTETRENDIRLVTVASGMGQLDIVRFEPI